MLEDLRASDQEWEKVRGELVMGSLCMWLFLGWARRLVEGPKGSGGGGGGGDESGSTCAVEEERGEGGPSAIGAGEEEPEKENGEGAESEWCTPEEALERCMDQLWMPSRKNVETGG